MYTTIQTKTAANVFNIKFIPSHQSYNFFFFCHDFLFFIFSFDQLRSRIRREELKKEQTEREKLKVDGRYFIARAHRSNRKISNFCCCSS